jgi:ankyrin repeat domain-containing protein 50
MLIVQIPMMLMMMAIFAKSHQESMVSLCTAGDLKRVREIVEVNQDFLLDRDVEFGFDCTIVSAREGHLDLVKYLVSQGASTRNRDLENQWTALMWASYEGHVDIVKFLESASPGSLAEALRDVSGVGDIDMMTKLLDLNANPDIKGMGGVTALMQASMYGHEDAVRLLLSRGADSAIRNVDGMTSLFVAVRYDHIETSRLLLDSNIELLETTDRSGRTPLHVACANGKTATAQMMISLGANLNRKSHQGDTPLFLLVEAATKEKPLSDRGRDAPTRKLLFNLDFNNLDVNSGAVDRHGTTALMFASMSCDLDIVKLFVRHGANINAETKIDGRVVNAFELAKRCDKPSRDWLSSHGFHPISKRTFVVSRERVIVLGVVGISAVIVFAVFIMLNRELQSKKKST